MDKSGGVADGSEESGILLSVSDSGDEGSRLDYLLFLTLPTIL